MDEAEEASDSGGAREIFLQEDEGRYMGRWMLPRSFHGDGCEDEQQFFKNLRLVNFFGHKCQGGPLVQTAPWLNILVSGFLGFVMFGFGLFFVNKALVAASLCGFCRGPLLAHRVPPVIEGRRGCSSFPSLPSSALPLMGKNETVRCLSEAGLIHR